MVFVLSVVGFGRCSCRLGFVYLVLGFAGWGCLGWASGWVSGVLVSLAWVLSLWLLVFGDCVCYV